MISSEHLLGNIPDRSSFCPAACVALQCDFAASVASSHAAASSLFDLNSVCLQLELHFRVKRSVLKRAAFTFIEFSSSISFEDAVLLLAQ